MKLIGLTGKARSGKDTVAQYLEEMHLFLHYKFAGNLRKAVQAAFALTDEEVADENKEVTIPFWGTSHRKMLQYIGTEFFRDQIQKLVPDVENDFWIMSLEKSLLKKRGLANLMVCISDCRFPNEVQWVLDNDGIIIDIQRPQLRLAVGIEGHSSEQLELAEFSQHNERIYKCENNGTLGELYNAVDAIVTPFIA